MKNPNIIFGKFDFSSDKTTFEEQRDIILNDKDLVKICKLLSDD